MADGTRIIRATVDGLLDYLNDVIIFGKTFEEHLQRLSMVLQQFQEAGLKLKPNKCFLFETWVTFLGHVLTPEGVLPDSDNVQKIKTWPVQSCVTDV